MLTVWSRGIGLTPAPFAQEHQVSQETCIVDEVFEHQNHDGHQNNTHGVGPTNAKTWRQQANHRADN
jgi:hypothetical protein